VSLNRDPRRAASPREKQEIYLMQDGLCHFCGCVLIEGSTEFHHLKEWAKGGVTDPENMVACCVKCHREIHSNV
jgi:5-methylcytosine-specific restriction endonuclease McrA